MATGTLNRPTIVIATDRCCPTTATSPDVTEAEAVEYAEWFKALADPTRIRILNLLAAQRGTGLRLRHRRPLLARPTGDFPPPQGPARCPLHPRRAARHLHVLPRQRQLPSGLPDATRRILDQ